MEALRDAEKLEPFSFMEVFREAQQVERSTSAGSPIFRQKAAIKVVVVAHVVDLIHHHGVILGSGDYPPAPTALGNSRTHSNNGGQGQVGHQLQVQPGGGG
ncbi:unnamed protein product [Ectocarpus fasciculatus]